ncbi:hypothetical protein [Janthinobacterium sp. MDT1-19]|uniref:hypothetical protein n=1 Tax=Janthinobacterium sp. MDT1-19 TaxID=1259339 RepID=UPI003F200730
MAPSTSWPAPWAPAAATCCSWRSSAALDDGQAGGHAPAQGDIHKTDPRCWPAGRCARTRTRSAPLARPAAAGGRIRKSGGAVDQLASAVGAGSGGVLQRRSSAALDDGQAGGHAPAQGDIHKTDPRCWPAGRCARARTRSAPQARPAAAGGRIRKSGGAVDQLARAVGAGSGGVLQLAIERCAR